MTLAISIQRIPPEDTYPLRHAVLWPAKPLDYVKIEHDAQGLHFGAFSEQRLVAVISLFVEKEEARFRKFAVEPAYQRQGIGTVLLAHVMQEAQRLGAHSIACDARLEATGLYEKFGMAPQGDIFYKGPLAYVRMQKALSATSAAGFQPR